jgi:ATP-dependent DNA ligase
MPKSPFEPGIPTRGTKVPDRPEWIHEIKHDGYRLIVQREGKRVRLFTRNGHDWSDRFLSRLSIFAFYTAKTRPYGSPYPPFCGRDTISASEV